METRVVCTEPTSSVRGRIVAMPIKSAQAMIHSEHIQAVVKRGTTESSWCYTVTEKQKRQEAKQRHVKPFSV